jgi:hypothetical protein
MGTELPTKVMLGQTLVLMQMTFLNNARKVGRLVLSRTSCFIGYACKDVVILSSPEQLFTKSVRVCRSSINRLADWGLDGRYVLVVE